MSNPILSTVTSLRAAPPLTAISAQLRQLADFIDAGSGGELEYADVRAAYVVLVKDGEFKPLVHMWGDVADRHGVAGLFQHCAQLALTDRTDGEFERR